MDAFSTIKISPEIQRLFHLFYLLHGVRLSLFTAQGRRVYPSEQQPDCYYCRMIRRELGLEERCRTLDRRMIRLSLEENRIIHYHCHGGMEEAALPLKVDGKVLGCIMLGQFRRDRSRRSPYADRWQQEFGTTALQQAYDDTPVFSSEKIQVLMDVYQGILDMVMRERLIRYSSLDLKLPVIRRIEDDLCWSPTLEEAASWIGRSPSSLTRQFRNITGKSFKRYLVLYKLDQADRMMQEQPRKPLNKISWELDYHDPLYFSRLY